MKNSNNHNNHNKDKQEKGHHAVHDQMPSSVCYNLNFRFDPITPEAGEPTELILSITDQKLGDPIKKFELVHDKLMHVIIVGEDLSYFAYIHPTANDDIFTISHILPESGNYKL